jgi:hypothetical protein
LEQQAKEVLLNNIESLYACGGNIQDKIFQPYKRNSKQNIVWCVHVIRLYFPSALAV